MLSCPFKDVFVQSSIHKWSVLIGLWLVVHQWCVIHSHCSGVENRSMCHGKLVYYSFSPFWRSLNYFHLIPDLLGFLFRNFCSEISVPNSKNSKIHFFSWLFSFSSKVYIGFWIKHLSSAPYSVHLRHFWHVWVSIPSGDSSRNGKTESAQDSRHGYALLVRASRWSEEYLHETDLILTKYVFGGCC